MNRFKQKKRMSWYNKIYVQWELVKCMKDREVMFMKRTDNSHTIRGMFIRHVDMLQKAFQIFRFFDNDYNIYISVAKYKHIPLFTPDLRERSKFTAEWFSKKAEKEIFEYDMLFDFDMKEKANYTDMKIELEKFLDMLERFRICFSFYPSGNNFQIVIPYFVHRLQHTKITDLTRKMKDRFSLKFLDLKGIGVYNKVRKCPFSMVGDKVCFPFKSIDYFKKYFHYDLVDSRFLLQNGEIKDHGEYLFNLYLPEINKLNWERFLYKNYLN